MALSVGRRNRGSARAAARSATPRPRSAMAVHLRVGPRPDRLRRLIRTINGTNANRTSHSGRTNCKPRALLNASTSPAPAGRRVNPPTPNSNSVTRATPSRNDQTRKISITNAARAKPATATLAATTAGPKAVSKTSTGDPPNSTPPSPSDPATSAVPRRRKASATPANANVSTASQFKPRKSMVGCIITSRRAEPPLCGVRSGIRSPKSANRNSKSPRAGRGGSRCRSRGPGRPHRRRRPTGRRACPARSPGRPRCRAIPRAP